MDAVKVFADAERTIPVDFSDAEVIALNSRLLAAQQDQMIAVQLAIKTAQAAAAAVQRAMPIVALDLPETDPRVVGLLAELQAAREQSCAAAEIAKDKMQIVVSLLKALEKRARETHLRFN
jgi:hypothetical protein